MKDTAEKAIQDLLKDKNLNLTMGDSNVFDYGRIPFGIPALDTLTGGGIPKKRMTLVYGPTNVGKSYLSSQIVAQVQKQGGRAAWIATELSWDADWMAKCGIDAGAVVVGQPSSGEQAMDSIKALATSGEFDVIVLDSIAGLVPAQNMDEDFSFSPMAWQARFVNSSLPRLLPSLHNGTALVCINQVRASMGPVALENMPGGKAQTYFAHFLLEVRRNGWIEESGEKVGFDMQVRLRKTKVGGQNWKSAAVPFRVDGGIDILESYIREAIEQGFIKKAGAWYTYEDVKAQGMNGLKQIFIDTPELEEQLINDIS